MNGRDRRPIKLHNDSLTDSIASVRPSPKRHAGSAITEPRLEASMLPRQRPTSVASAGGPVDVMWKPNSPAGLWRPLSGARTQHVEGRRPSTVGAGGRHENKYQQFGAADTAHLIQHFKHLSGSKEKYVHESYRFADERTDEGTYHCIQPPHSAHLTDVAHLTEEISWLRMALSSQHTQHDVDSRGWESERQTMRNVVESLERKTDAERERRVTLEIRLKSLEHEAEFSAQALRESVENCHSLKLRFRLTEISPQNGDFASTWRSAEASDDSNFLRKGAVCLLS